MSNLSDTTTLLKIEPENDKFQLTMMDGSRWSVEPGDLLAIVTWLPATEVMLEENNDGSIYNFDITNISDGVTVKATLYV